MKKLFTLLTFLLFASQALAGPFGVNSGTDLVTLDTIKEIAPGKYMFNPPKKHPAFSSYAVQASKTYGVCWIMALGKSINTSSHGTELRAEFDKLSGKLAKSYGKNKKYDFLMPGSIWDDSKNYMMSLIKKDRTLAAVWSKKHGSELNNNLKVISLGVNATGMNAGYLTLEYIFDNYDACTEEINEKIDDSL